MVKFKTLSMAIAATTLSFFAIGINSAQAALLQFSFTTKNFFNIQETGSGSFLLDTETPASSEVIPLLDATGAEVVGEGREYRDAVSNFFFSSPGAGTFNYATLDLGVFFLFKPSASFPLPFGAISPRQCSDLESDCPIQVGLDYLGNLTEFPILSANPESYKLLNVIAFQAGVAKLTFDEVITSPSATAVPAPAVFPGVLAAGALGVVYRKRQSKKVSA